MVSIHRTKERTLNLEQTESEQTDSLEGELKLKLKDEEANWIMGLTY